MSDIMHTHFFDLIAQMCDKISLFGEKLHFSDVVTFVIAGLIALAIGCAGLYMYRIVTGLGVGFVGFFAGVSIFGYLVERYTVLEKMSGWMAYVLGGILAILFFYFGFKKSTYAMFAVYMVIGYYVTTQFFIDRSAVAFGGAFLFAMVSVFALKYSFIFASATLTGFSIMAFASRILPNFAAIRLVKGNIAGTLIAVCVALMFAVVQTGITARYRFTKKYIVQ